MVYPFCSSHFSGKSWEKKLTEPLISLFLFCLLSSKIHPLAIGNDIFFFLEKLQSFQLEVKEPEGKFEEEKGTSVLVSLNLWVFFSWNEYWWEDFGGFSQ